MLIVHGLEVQSNKLRAIKKVRETTVKGHLISLLSFLRVLHLSVFSFNAEVDIHVHVLFYYVLCTWSWKLQVKVYE